MFQNAEFNVVAALTAGAVTLLSPSAFAAGDDDCNQNGIPDIVEIELGEATDVNENGIPDICELLLEIGQIHWQGGDDTGPVEAFSDWGQLRLHVPPDLGGLLPPLPSGTFGGWVNVGIGVNGQPPHWAVMNLPIQLEDPGMLELMLPWQVPFDLGIPQGEPALFADLQFLITPFPLPELPPMQPNLFDVPILPVDLLYGGLADPALDIRGATDVAGPWMIDAVNFGQPMPQVSILCPPVTIVLPEAQANPVDEEVNGCAPASVARSLDYLQRQCPDLGLPDVQSIYEGLRDAMESDVGKGGCGTYQWEFEGDDECDPQRGMIPGKLDYLDALGIGHRIVTTTSTDFSQVAECLGQGADVELLVFWGNDADGESLGGHAAWVVGMQAIKNADGAITGWFVDIVDDGHQGDGVASNDKTTLQFDAEGNLVGGGEGAAMMDFVIEKKVDPIPGDANGDGTVDFLDIVAVLSAWGPCDACPQDFDGDGAVSFSDLLIVLSAYGV